MQTTSRPAAGPGSFKGQITKPLSYGLLSYSRFAGLSDLDTNVYRYFIFWWAFLGLKFVYTIQQFGIFWQWAMRRIQAATFAQPSLFCCFGISGLLQRN
jgi:hypothetical protein